MHSMHQPPVHRHRMQQMALKEGWIATQLQLEPVAVHDEKQGLDGLQLAIIMAHKTLCL